MAIIVTKVVTTEEKEAKRECCSATACSTFLQTPAIFHFWSHLGVGVAAARAAKPSSVPQMHLNLIKRPRIRTVLAPKTQQRPSRSTANLKQTCAEWKCRGSSKCSDHQRLNERLLRGLRNASTAKEMCPRDDIASKKLLWNFYSKLQPLPAITGWRRQRPSKTHCLYLVLVHV